MKFISTVILLIITLSTFGQSRIELTYFTLGLVDDYLGRSLVKDDKLDLAKIDFFHQTEIDIMDYLDSVIRVENSLKGKQDQIDFRKVRRKDRNCTNCHEYFICYSKRLAHEVNSKYKFKFAKSWDNKNRKMYYGLLKKSSFRTTEEQLSFLTGAFVKFGGRDGDIYVYGQANSLSKFKAIQGALKKLGCQIISVTTTENTIPTSQEIKFKPTTELKERLDKLESLKLKVFLKKTDFFKEKLTDEVKN